MSAELLERRSRSRTPTSLYGSPRRKQTSRPPSSLHFFSSFTAHEISEVVFQCRQSPVENHTDGFTPHACHSALITRRGNTLVIKIITSVQLSSAYIVTLTFVPVHRPRERFGQFRARGVARESSELWLSIDLPVNFPVGKYHTHVSLALGGGTEVLTYYHHQPIVVLFNPWNSDDASYVKDESEIDEYVMCDVGRIPRGTVSNKTTLTWEYGQFEDSVLDAALYLLCGLTADDSRSPVTVAREIVSQVVTRDNSGVMVMGGGVTGATHPCRWNGSTLIIQKYHRTKTPVRSGQCWVFCGVTISLLRALGLASRPVTCYNSAHFTSKAGTVERHFTTDGELLDTRDQIWLYQVWVEVWMCRRDLPPGYDGWQMVDPTPQDKQSGRYRIGPVPVGAVKQRKSLKKRGFGCEYVISTICCDTKYMRVGNSPASNKPHTLAHVRKDEVAMEIVAMGISETSSAMLLDVTTEYRDVATPPQPHISRFPRRDCSFEVGCEGVRLGECVTLVTSIRNNGAMLRTVDGRVMCHVTYYTGRLVRRFASVQFTGVISPGQSASVSVPLPTKQYLPHLVEQAMILFFVAVKVRESQQLFLKSHPYQLLLPSLEIECSDSVAVGSTLRIKLKFRNILTCSLSRVVFLIQAGRLCTQRELSSKRLVVPGGLVCVELVQRVNCPVRTYTLIASMHCDKLTDIHGHRTVQVVDSPP